MFETVVFVWILILILVVVTLFAGVKTVPQGSVWTVERFGAYRRMLHPGLNFVMPYVDQVRKRLNVQEQVVDIPEQSVITRDNASVSVDGVIYFRVMEPEKAAYQVADLVLALTTLAMTNIRAVIGEMELDATLSSRERINSSLLTILDGATMPWGREGQPGGDPQDRAAREPDPCHEPADDRRTRAPGRGRARRR